MEVIEETKPVPVSEEKPEPVAEEKPEAPAAEKPRSKWSFGFLKKNAKQETAPVEEKAEEVVEEKPAEEASPEPVVEEKPEPVAEEKTEAQAAEKPRSRWNLGFLKKHPAKEESTSLEDKAEEVVEVNPAEEAKPEPVAEEKTEAQAAEKPRSKWNLGSHSFHKVFGRGNKNAE